MSTLFKTTHVGAIYKAISKILFQSNINFLAQKLGTKVVMIKFISFQETRMSGNEGKTTRGVANCFQMTHCIKEDST